MSDVENRKQTKKVNGQKLFLVITAIFLVLSHAAVLSLIALSFQYYAIYPEVFGSTVAIVVCVLIITDIIFFVGFNHQDLALKIIACVLSVLIFISGSIGVYAIAKVNGMLDGILSDGSDEQYETYSGVFVTNNKEIKKLDDLNKKKIGLLFESTNGITYIARGLLSENKIDYIDKNYQTNTELIQALIDGEVDAIVTTSAYRNIYQNDENSTIKDSLDSFIDFYTFEKDLKVKTNKSKKDLTKDPFNVLLIGYSRTELGSPIGLADAIIVATINPQTYTVSMMSIARDSFVPISCYGGSYDKINSGRSTSRACFIETVEDFIGMDIDYYMEADYLAIVYMVNALGGVEIDNPVDFELDGVYVPAGKYVAEGWQALEFCRERHHMPNGDFDRQKHQKEVIIEIAKKLVESGDVSRGLTIMNGISEWFSTDFTLQELSGVFNLLLNTKNYTNLSTFSLVDFQTLRITGDGGIKYYSYSMHLPLWVYLIYQGSYDESMQHINEVMGNFDSIEQERSFKFSARAPYVREPFYSETYENKFLFTPDPMPAYWIDLTGEMYLDALEWANDNNIDLQIENILPDNPQYDSELEGTIIEQSVKYGSLISDYPSGKVIVMGTGEIDESKQVPNFIGKYLDSLIEWTSEYSVNKEVSYENVEDDSKNGKIISQSSRVGTDIEECRAKGGISVVVGSREYDTNLLIGKNTSAIIEWAQKNLYYEPKYVYEDSTIEGTDEVIAISYNTSDNNDLFTFSKDVEITIRKYRKEFNIEVIGGSGSGKYKEGDYVTITAMPSENEVFEKWDDGNTEKTRKILVEADSKYVAKYSTIEACDPSSGCNGYDETTDGVIWACTLTTYSDSTTECNCKKTIIEQPEEGPGTE